jgi:TMEM175 potassium channel family protein
MPSVHEPAGAGTLDHIHDVPAPPTLGKTRVETLVDGVFAIAMTLLVLELKVPEVEGPMLPALWELRTSFLAYAVSFANLGVYWTGHNAQMDVVKRSTRVLIWINILFMLFIALIPFSTALLAQHTTDRVAVIFYASNMLLSGLLLYANWRYATDHHRLVAHDISDALVRLGGRRTLVGVVVTAAAILFALVDTRMSVVLLAALPLYYIFPGAVDSLWEK